MDIEILQNSQSIIHLYRTCHPAGSMQDGRDRARRQQAKQFTAYRKDSQGKLVLKSISKLKFYKEIFLIQI